MNFLKVHRNSISFMGFSFLLSFFWLAGVWPGYVQQDSLDYIYEAQKGSIFDWLTYSLCLLTNVAIRFKNPIGFISITFICIFCYLLNYLRQQIEFFYNSKMSWIYCSLILINPLILSMNIFFSREVPFAFVNTLLALMLFDWKYRKTKIGDWQFLGWILLLGILSELRQDARIYLVVYPIIAYAVRIFDKKNAAMAFIGGLSVNIIIIFSCSLYYSKPTPFKDQYLLTATYSVLMAQDSLTEADYQDIYPVVQLNISDLKSSSDAYTYLLEKTRIKSKAIMLNYYTRIIKLLLGNPIPFLKSRILFTAKAMGLFDGYSEWFSDYFGSKTDYSKRPDLAALGFKRQPFSKFIYGLHVKFENTFLLNGFSKRMVFSNFFSLLMTFFLLCSWRITPLSSALSLVFLIKFIIIFFLSPLHFANYFYISYLGGFFLFPLAIMEVRRTSFMADLKSSFRVLARRMLHNKKVQYALFLTRSIPRIEPSMAVSEKILGMYIFLFVSFGTLMTFAWKQVYFDNGHLVYRLLGDRHWIIDFPLTRFSGAILQTPTLLINWILIDYNLSIWAFCFSVLALPLSILFSIFYYSRNKKYRELPYVLLINLFIFVIPIWTSVSSNYWEAIIYFWPLYIYIIIDDKPKTSILAFFCILLLGTNEMSLCFTVMALFLLWKERKLSNSNFILLILMISFQLFNFSGFVLKNDFPNILISLKYWYRNPLICSSLIVFGFYLSITIKKNILSKIAVAVSCIALFFLFRFVLESELSGIWHLNYENRLLAIPLSCVVLFLGYDLVKNHKYVLSSAAILLMIFVTIPSFVIDVRVSLEAIKSINNISLYMKFNEGCRILNESEKSKITDRSLLPDWSLPYLTTMLNESSSVKTIFFNSKSPKPYTKCLLSKDQQFVWVSATESAHLHNWSAYYFSGLRRSIAGESKILKSDPLILIAELKRNKFQSTEIITAHSPRYSSK